MALTGSFAFATTPVPPTPTPTPTPTIPVPVLAEAPEGDAAWLCATTVKAIGLLPVSADTPGASTQAPEWQAGLAYTAGQTVSYQGGEYRARWWTQNEVPQAGGWGAWELQVGASSMPQWSSAQTFLAGQQVRHEGKIYQARWWTKGDTPGNENGVWQFVRNDNLDAMNEVWANAYLHEKICRRPEGSYRMEFFQTGVYMIYNMYDAKQVVTTLKITGVSPSSTPWVPARYTEAARYEYRGIYDDIPGRPPMNVSGGLRQPWLCSADDICRGFGI
ncbi:carbohydrate-binding protein [Chitinibacteraceae bacterium HSL-7]